MEISGNSPDSQGPLGAWLLLGGVGPGHQDAGGCFPTEVHLEDQAPRVPEQDHLGNRCGLEVPRGLAIPVLGNFPPQPLPGGEPRALRVQSEPQGLGPPKPFLAWATPPSKVRHKCHSVRGCGQTGYIWNLSKAVLRMAGFTEEWGVEVGVQTSDKAPWLPPTKGASAHCFHTSSTCILVSQSTLLGPSLGT